MAVVIKDVQQKALTSVGSAACPAFATNPAAGDCIYVTMTTFNPTTGYTHQAPTDSTGVNTYTQIGTSQLDSSGNFIVSRWKAQNITGGSSFVVTAHVSITVAGLTVIAWCLNGVTTTAYNSDTHPATATSTNPASGNTSPGPSGNSIFIGGCSFLGGGTTLTDGSGWNTTGANGFTAGMLTNAKQTDNATFEAIYTEYKMASSAQSATWTASSDTWFAHAESFLETAAGGASPFIPNGGFLPPGTRVPSIDLKTHLDAVKLNLLGKDKFFSAPGIGPDYDYPNPKGAAFPLDDRTFTDASEFWMLKDTFFGPAGKGPAYDWPNPSLGKPFPIECRTFFDPSEIWLYGKDQFFGAAGMGPSYSYPNPPGRAPAIDLRTWLINLQQSTLGIVISAAPFTVTNWPNPLRSAPPVALRTLLCPLMDTLAGLDQFFGMPGQPLAFEPPPNPIGKPYPVDVRTFFNAPSQTLAGLDQFFGAAGEPPTFSPIVNPWGKPFPLDGRTYIDPSETWLLKDQFYGAAGQPPMFTPAPNPWGKPYPSDLRTFIDRPARELEGQDTFFGAPGQGPSYQWPVPPGRLTAIDLRSWLVNLLSSTLAVIQGQNPFTVTDWPNPVTLRAAMELRTFLNSVETQLIGQDAFFAGAGEGPTFYYPNPRGKAFPSDLRTFLNALEVQLNGQDAFFGAAGQGPHYDYPNPRGRAPLVDPRHGLVNLLTNTLRVIPSTGGFRYLVIVND